MARTSSADPVLALAVLSRPSRLVVPSAGVVVARQIVRLLAGRGGTSIYVSRAWGDTAVRWIAAYGTSTGVGERSALQVAQLVARYRARVLPISPAWDAYAKAWLVKYG